MAFTEAQRRYLLHMKQVCAAGLEQTVPMTTISRHLTRKLKETVPEEERLAVLTAKIDDRTVGCLLWNFFHLDDYQRLVGLFNAGNIHSALPGVVDFFQFMSTAPTKEILIAKYEELSQEARALVAAAPVLTYGLKRIGCMVSDFDTYASNEENLIATGLFYAWNPP